MIKNLIMWLIYGILIGVPAGILSAVILLPMYALIAISGMSFIGIIGIAVGFIVLGWWSRFVVKKIHIMGG